MHVKKTLTFILSTSVQASGLPANSEEKWTESVCFQGSCSEYQHKAVPKSHCLRKNSIKWEQIAISTAGEVISRANITGFKQSKLTQEKWNTPVGRVSQASSREPRSPISLGRFRPPPWDCGWGLTAGVPQSCFSSERTAQISYGCYKFPQGKGAMARNRQSLGGRMEKKGQCLTSLTSVIFFLTSHGYFDCWLTM